MFNKLLILSAFLFVLPFLNIFFIRQKKWSNYEKFLSILFLINFLLSFLFWYHPVKDSIIHNLDAFFVKFSILCVFIYITFIKQIDIFYQFIFYGMFCIFYSLAIISDACSKKEWCSIEHIIYHFCMHIIGITGSYIAFI